MSMSLNDFCIIAIFVLGIVWIDTLVLRDELYILVFHISNKKNHHAQALLIKVAF